MPKLNNKRHRRRLNRREKEMNYHLNLNKNNGYHYKHEDFKDLEEDLLKIIYEGKDHKVSKKFLTEFFNKRNIPSHRIIKHFHRNAFLHFYNNSVSLTPNGILIAKEIFKRHNKIENFIKGKGMACDAHEMAHILEHELTTETIQKIIKASELKEKGRPLINFSLPFGTIVGLDLPDCKVWTKLISIGIFPGQKIHIIEKNSTNFLLEVKNSRIAIDKILANGILVIP
jgi:Mn-dependent DtxR family transcriptional regulator/Fe2+ transport system protein FeoA